MASHITLQSKCQFENTVITERGTKHQNIARAILAFGHHHTRIRHRERKEEILKSGVEVNG